MDASIHLPAPQKTGGKPLMDCLNERHTTRAYKRDEVPPQELSNVLWAAFGATRPDSGTGIGHDGSHTAPCACNSQSIDVYVALPNGLFLYEPHAHIVRPRVSLRSSGRCSIARGLPRCSACGPTSSSRFRRRSGTRRRSWGL